ncbi:MAG: hypothetical protein A3H51_00255 [Candidatus Spechtbacteria bacterium RIFCSPLOWO2_02_FULL_38_8]|uniref:Uncharacterized protein n=1 Tax=Candidatus Spechtbacteria bacterium RIFCSPLOWO2_02_FULL_38_8 TaxID=1802164 RepID=A0A1G2HHU8_9BACT|nr:MAG: hypothetical protein A3H51_00255 [Candidatus Spechtbacteria bacterium RIFCSPLOWO2_02_FULL_38_8]
MKSRIKTTFFVGFFILLPIFVVIVLLDNILARNHAWWRPFFRIVGIRGAFAPWLAVVLSLSLVFLIGTFALSRLAWPSLKNKARNIWMFFGGGYTKVWYDEFGLGKKREGPGIVMGKFVLVDENGNNQVKLAVTRPRIPIKIQPVSPEEAPIIVSNMNVWSYEWLGAIPAEIKLKPWTERSLKVLPMRQMHEKKRHIRKLLKKIFLINKIN